MITEPSPRSVHLRDGSYGLIEIKLGGDTLIAEGAANLNTLAEKIDTTKMRKPSFKMVLTAVGQYAYMRADGVMVVPIGCLKDLRRFARNHQLFLNVT